MESSKNMSGVVMKKGDYSYAKYVELKTIGDSETQSGFLNEVKLNRKVLLAAVYGDVGAQNIDIARAVDGSLLPFSSSLG